MAQSHYCQLKNNSGLSLSTVVISTFGQGHYFLEPGELIIVRFCEGKKVVISWDNQTQELLDFHCICVAKPALFRLIKSTTMLAPGTAGMIVEPASEYQAHYEQDLGDPTEEGVSASLIDSGT